MSWDIGPSPRESATVASLAFVVRRDCGQRSRNGQAAGSICAEFGIRAAWHDHCESLVAMKLEITCRDGRHTPEELRGLVLHEATVSNLNLRRIRRLHVDIDCRDEDRPACRATAQLYGTGELWALGRGPALSEAIFSAVRQLRARQPARRWAITFSSVALTVVAVALTFAYLT
jgi:hypothetical protein